MIAGYHLIWTNYGHWLPNDPRGSVSHELRSAKLAPLGDLHFGRKKIQPAGSEIKEFYAAAQGLLRYSLLTFDESQVQLIGETFSRVVHDRTYTCYACAIMPDHVHLVIRKHRDQAEIMIHHLQDASRRDLHNTLSHDIDLDHPIWGGPGWKVFLDSRDDIERTVRYIEQNPVKIGQMVQRWSFVSEYDGWLPGQVRTAKPQARGTTGERKS